MFFSMKRASGEETTFMYLDSWRWWGGQEECEKPCYTCRIHPKHISKLPFGKNDNKQFDVLLSACICHVVWTGCLDGFLQPQANESHRGCLESCAVWSKCVRTVRICTCGVYAWLRIEGCGSRVLPWKLDGFFDRRNDQCYLSHSHHNWHHLPLFAAEICRNISKLLYTNVMDIRRLSIEWHRHRDALDDHLGLDTPSSQMAEAFSIF